MKITKRQLREIIQNELDNESLNELSLSDIFGKKVTSVEDVTTVGDLKKLVKYAQSQKRAEAGKEAAKEWAKSSFWDETFGKIPGLSTAKNAADMLKTMYNMPDESRVGTALDVLDVDDDVAAIVDDPIENDFLKVYAKELGDMDDNQPLSDVNVTLGLSNYMKDKFAGRTVIGFNEGTNNMKLSKKKLKQIILEEYQKIISEARFSELPNYSKGSPVELHGIINKSDDHHELRDEVIDLINRSYAYTKAKKNFDYYEADHLVSNYDLDSFMAWDIDEDPSPDVVRGMKSKGGKMKLTVSGQDGSSAASSFSAADTLARLMDGSHFAEMSGRSAGAMMRDGVPVITDEATVRSLLPGKDIIWYGKHPDPDSFAAQKTAERGPNGEYDGWYERTVSGNTGVYKLMFGAV